MRCCAALVALAAVPAAGRAADLTDLFPDDTRIVVGVDVKAVMGSPLGKKVVGADTPFEAARKLLKVLFDLQGILPLGGDATKPITVVANKVQRVTVVLNAELETATIFLEGEIDDGEFAEAGKAVAKVLDKQFREWEVGGNRKALVLDKGAPADRTWGWFAARVNKTLLVISSKRDVVTTALSRYDGERKGRLPPKLADALRKVDPRKTPFWLVAGEIPEGSILPAVSLLAATLSLADDADIRVEVEGKNGDWAKRWEGLLRVVSNYNDVWKAAAIKVVRDGTNVTAAGSIPGKVLAAKYADRAAPAAVARARDPVGLVPDDSAFVAGIDVKGVMNSPLGRKTFGADKPSDATRKLLKACVTPLGEMFLPLTGDAAKPLAALANKVERLTVAVGSSGGFVILLEGEITLTDFATAAKPAKERGPVFAFEKLGSDGVLVLPGEALVFTKSDCFGTWAGDSLFVIASSRDLLAEVCNKHDGKKKGKLPKSLSDLLGGVKPADTPLWVVAANDTDGGFATVSLKDDVDIRIEIGFGNEATAKEVTAWLGNLFDPKEVNPSAERDFVKAFVQSAVWKGLVANGPKVERDGKKVTATASIPGKLLADEYAKQK